jgi:replicative DNA helicase
MTDNLSKFANSFQTKAISVMLSDKAFLDQAIDIIDPKHFESDSHAWIVEKILWYFGEYRNIPTMDVFKQEIDKLGEKDVLKTSTVIALKEIYKNLQASDIKYVKDEFLEFCKNQALKNAILKAADKLGTGDYEGIKVIVDKAMNAGQERNYGHNWKQDIEKRIVHNVRQTIGTEWSVVNEIMDGGLGGGELGVIVAPPGIGKSWALSSIGIGGLRRGKRVLHYTLELNEDYLGLRYDTLTTGYEPNQIRHHVDKVKRAMEEITGDLILKYYPTRCASSMTFRAHIDRITSTGFAPDLILVDYADLMRPTEKSDARYQDLGVIYEDLRGLAGELKVPLWTASQSQRSSMNDEVIEADKIAESFNKIMTADFIMSISRRLADKQSSTGRAHIIKNRFGPDGITMPAYIDPSHGRFDIFDENSSEGIRIKKQMADGENNIKKMLNQKLIDFSASRETAKSTTPEF